MFKLYYSSKHKRGTFNSLCIAFGAPTLSKYLSIDKVGSTCMAHPLSYIYHIHYTAYTQYIVHTILYYNMCCSEYIYRVYESTKHVVETFVKIDAISPIQV